MTGTYRSVYPLSPPLIVIAMRPPAMRPILIPVIPSWVRVPVIMFDRIDPYAHRNRRWTIRRIIVTPGATQHAETQEGEEEALHSVLLGKGFSSPGGQIPCPSFYGE